MSRTKTIVGVVAGAVGAGIVYKIATKDTAEKVGVPWRHFEPNSNSQTKFICSSRAKQFDLAIKKSQELLKRFKDEIATPGVVIGVSVDGNIIWEEGIGLADVENRLPCHPKTAMRIASISKPITVAALAKLWEDGKVNLDKPIQEYVSYFPIKKFEGQNVVITTRQLASHTSGIRHYKKKDEENSSSFDGGPEFYIKERYETVQDSVNLFKADELLFKPGTSRNYTTHGYTLLSAVMEEAAKKPFTLQMQEFFQLFGLRDTFLDEVSKLIYNRASYYTKDKHGKIINAELADTSYKWAGGGFISTVGDLLRFGNAMLYCYQQTETDKPGYLKKETVKEMWTMVDKTSMKWGRDSGYGLGWIVVPQREEYGGLKAQRFYVGHGGGAVGASSVLIIVPDDNLARVDENNNEVKLKLPSGVLVAVLTNLQNASCHNLARDVAELFYEAQILK